MGGVVLGDHKDTGCLPVEPVHDPRPFDSPDDGEIAAVVQEGVHQGDAAGAGPGVDRESRRLVDDQEIGVLVEDRERQGLGLEMRRAGRWQLDLDVLAAAHGVGGARRPAQDAHASGPHQALQRSPAFPGQEGGKDPVQALAAGLRGEIETQRSPGLAGPGLTRHCVTRSAGPRRRCPGRGRDGPA